MALLERVKERFSPDLSDEELKRMIDEAVAEIVKRYGGPDPDATIAPVTITLEGGSIHLMLDRPIDEAEDVELLEDDGDAELALAVDDYRVWHRGRQLERLSTGTNARSTWGGLVTITYTPVDDRPQRAEVAIKLVKLSIDYEGVSSEDIDGYRTAFANYTKEREALLRSLAPSAVLMA